MLGGTKQGGGTTSLPLANSQSTQIHVISEDGGFVGKKWWVRNFHKSNVYELRETPSKAMVFNVEKVHLHPNLSSFFPGFHIPRKEAGNIILIFQYDWNEQFCSLGSKSTEKF